MAKQKRNIPYIVYIAAVVLICLLLSKFCFQLTLVQGESMEPSYHGGQLLLINKMSKDYRQGDCVVAKVPGVETYIVKRVAAVSGDTIYIVDGSIFVNGEVYTPYPDAPSCDYGGIAAQPVQIPEGRVFVLGDNFNHSIDSRHGEVGLVDTADIIGIIK